MHRAAWILFAKLLAFAFNFVLPLLLVRRLSQSEFGLYKQSFLVVATAIAILPLGFGMTAYYFLPREAEKRCAVIFNILLFNFIMGGVALCILVFFPETLAQLLISGEVATKSPEMRGQIIALAPLIGTVAFFWLFSSFLELIAIANQETRQATIFIIIAQFTKSFLLIGAAAGFGTVRALLYAALVQGILQTIILLVYLHSRFTGFWHSFDFSMLKKQVLYALPYGVSGLLWTVQTDMHNYFVSHHFGQISFAIYSIGVFQLPLTGILTESVASVMIPRVSYLQSVDDRREIIRLTASAMRRLAIFFFPLYAVLMVMGYEFIVGLFTIKFSASVPVFLINLTLLPFSIVPLDSISRAYQELGRFITKMRLVFFFILLGGLWFAVKSGDLRLVVAIVIGVYVIENIIAVFKAGKIVGVEKRDVVYLKDVGKIALAVIFAASATFLVRKLLLPFEMKALILLSIGSAVFGLTYLAAFLGLKIPTEDEKEMVKSKLPGTRASLPAMSAKQNEAKRSANEG